MNQPHTFWEAETNRLQQRIAELEQEKKDLAEALRELHDFCGDPFNRYSERWRQAMNAAVSVLQKQEPQA